MTMKSTATRVRAVRVEWQANGGHYNVLDELADQVSAGMHHRTQSGETDEEFLGRVADEIRREFLEQAGDATGADGFAFETSFADAE